MKAQFIQSPDGTRLAYDVTGRGHGRGPALLLLHGAGKGRVDWHDLGYVQRLAQDFTVITVDLRGSGESDFLIEIEDYAIEKLAADVLAVADACQVARFAVWGYSLGGNLARYLGAGSDRVTAAVIVGVPFGPVVDQAFEQFIQSFVARWNPLAQAYRAGELSAQKRQSAIKGRMPVWTACFQAMRDWPETAPAEMRCPTLLAAGSRNTRVGQWLAHHRETAEAAGLRIEVLEGLTHPQEFSQVERIFPPAASFLKSVCGV